MFNREEIKKEMLSKINKEALEAYIQKTDMGGIDKCNLDENLDAWAEAKMDIYIKFGRSLTIEKVVECNISDHQCRGLREDFVKDYDGAKYAVANSFINSITIDEASNNYLNQDYWIFGTRFAKGMRVSRCFKQLMPSKLVNDYQTKFSMFIQKFKVQGKAVVSIDPIDYMTMSVNNSGWRSCHIISNGIHKAGCLSYMIDASTAISYTTDKAITANRKYEGLSYANKLWRQCVHIGKDYAIQARQYPGINHSNRNNVADLLVEVFNKYFEVDNYHQEEERSDELYDYQRDDDGNAYNDIYHESFSNGGGIISAPTSKTEERISINREAICVRCGKNTVSHSETLLCYSCEEETDYCNCDEDDDF